MTGYNRIVMIGNLTRDPELKQLPSGQSVCRLGLASNRQFKNKQTGIVSQEVCFVDIDVWGAQAESCSRYLKKGRPILVEGRLKLDSWKDAEGQNRNKHSIVADRVIFLGTGPGDDSSSEEQTGNSEYNQGYRTEKEQANKESNNKEKEENEFKDEPPFEDNLPF